MVRELSATEEMVLERINAAASYLWGLLDMEMLVRGNDQQALTFAKARLEEAIGWAVKGIT